MRLRLNVLSMWVICYLVIFTMCHAPKHSLLQSLLQISHKHKCIQPENYEPPAWNFKNISFVFSFNEHLTKFIFFLR